MKLLILFILFSCTTIEPVQLKGVAVTYMGAQDSYRLSNGEYKKLTGFLYQDDNGTVYELPFYKGVKAVIEIPK